MADLQAMLYVLVLILASLSGFFGIILANYIFSQRKLFSNVYLLVFTFLVLGYSFFALAEITWYLIFGVFGELPGISMPDFYWTAGSVSLLLGYLVFFGHQYQQQKAARKNFLPILLIAGGVIFLVIFFFLKTFIITAGESVGQTFVGYFYPLASALILLFSLGAYLLLEKKDELRFPFGLFMIANIAFLLADLLYVYYAFAELFGFIRILSDVLYVVAYGLCGLTFVYLLLRVRAGTKKGGGKK